jgi:PadR family transcriptional regulator PadR
MYGAIRHYFLSYFDGYCHTLLDEVYRCMTAKNPAFMGGVPELVVLRFLVDREMYGYEIARAIKVATGDALSLGEGVLYPALHVMESRGLVRTRSLRIEGRIRIYYTLTAKGRRRLARLTSDWQRMSLSMNSILGNPTHG